MKNKIIILVNYIISNFKTVIILLNIKTRSHQFSDKTWIINEKIIEIPPVSEPLTSEHSLEENTKNTQEFYYSVCALRLNLVRLFVSINALDDYPKTVAQLSQPKYFDSIEKDFVIKAKWTKWLNFYLCNMEYTITNNNIIYNIKNNDVEIFNLDLEIIAFLLTAYKSKICELTGDPEKNIHICSNLKFHYSLFKASYILPYTDNILFLSNSNDNVSIHFENEKYKFVNIKLNNTLLNEIDTILKKNYNSDLHDHKNILNYIGEEETDPAIVIERLKSYFLFNKFINRRKPMK